MSIAYEKMDLATVCAPGWELCSDLCDLASRELSIIDVCNRNGWCLTTQNRNGHDINVVL